MSAAISLRGVGKHFGSLQVLDAVSFDVTQGEIVALLGTSLIGDSESAVFFCGSDIVL